MPPQVERPGLGGGSGLLAAVRSFSRIAAAAVILVGLLVVVGWAFDLEVLKRLLRGRVAMNPVTALAFILGGASLRMSGAARHGPRTRRLARATGLAVAVVGLLRLGACLSGCDIGFDQWLFAAKLAASDHSVPNRMAPNTALTFVLIGLGLASLDWETSRGRRPAQYLGIAVALVALIALLGYAYGVDQFFDVPSFIPMALPTALAFAVLSVGLLCACPDRGLMAVITSEGAGGIMARRLLPAAVGMPALLGWLRLAGQQAGLYGTEFGTSLLVASHIVVFTVLIGRNAYSLYHSDIERKRAEEALRRMHDELEIRVRERTAELAGTNEVLRVEIAERKRNEEALGASEERFRQMAEHIQCAFWIASPTGSALHYISPAYEAIWGRPCQDIYDRPGSWVEALHPEDRVRVLASFARQVRSGEAWQEEYRIVRPDGSIRWISDRGFPIRGGRGEVRRVVGIADDITERRRVQESLREAEERFRVFMDHSPAVGFIKDEDGRLVYANRPFERLCGLRSDDWPGRTDTDLWPGETARRLRENDLATLLAGSGASEFEETFPTPVGPRQMRVFKFPFRDSAGRTLLGGMAIDVTDAKRAAGKIRRQNRLLRSRLGRIDALRQIDLAIATGPDLRRNLGVVIEQAHAQLGIDAADVLLFAPNAQDLECTAEKGFRTDALRQARLPRDEILTGQIVRERRTVHIADLARAPEHMIRAPQLVEEGFRAYWGVPLVAKGEVLGVLEVFHRTPMEPDAEWLEFLEVLAGQAAIAVDNVALFDEIQRSNAELVVAYDATIAGWSRALDLRDKETEGHCQRVTEMTLVLARAMGMSEAELMEVRRGALLHDIGKMGVPDSILLKPGKLTDEEWEVMRRHPGYAHEWLWPIPYLRPALDIPYSHHEKWDGTGYPRGLKGEGIPRAARLFAAVDIWDALRSDRPYRAGWPEDKVREHIRSLAGTHLDPEVVDAFLRILTPGDASHAVLSGAAGDTDLAPSEGMNTSPPAAGREALEERLRRTTEQNGHLERQGEEQRRVIARLTELSMTDELTGLKNRRYFGEALESAFSLAVRQDQPLSLAMLDVDHFKLYNDGHGHPAGDGVLRLVAERLREQLRAHDLVVRYGGEEFAILLPATDADEGRAIAERLRTVIAEQEWPLRSVTVSLGVATISPAILNSIQLVEEADRALYHSKAIGRDQVTHSRDLGPAPPCRRGHAAEPRPCSSPVTV